MALLVGTAVSLPVASAQTQQPDLDELWEQYPLETPEGGPGADGPRAVDVREETGSTGGPPPDPPTRAGPLPLAVLLLALWLAALGIAGAAHHLVVGLRRRRRG